ncbi:MAG TPA: hypothetical protein VE999_02015 [Gemmataceae bacterium]|nr:hypothetical protein [Gemmataceae bacterium]
MNDSTQIYDFNPGFGPKVSSVDSGNGFGTRVFWTAVIPDSDVQVNPAAGTAEMHVSNLSEVSYYSPSGFAGNISLGPNWQTAGVDANVSFNVVWNGPVTRRVNIKDAADGFAGLFNEVNNNNVTVQWSGSDASGFSFTSNVGNLATSTALAPGNFFAQLAHERNGIFFPAGSSANLASTTPQRLSNFNPSSVSTSAGSDESLPGPVGTAGALNPSMDQTAFDAALLARGLVGSPAAGLAIGPTLPVLTRSDTIAPSLTGDVQPVQRDAASHWSSIGDQSLQVIEHAFANLEGNTSLDNLPTGEVPTRSV